MTINGVSSTTVHLVHCVPTAPLLPTRERLSVKIVGRDGAVDFARNSYANRLIPVEMLVTATSESTLETYLDDVADWLSGEGYIVFDQDLTKRWNGKIYDSVVTERKPSIAKFTATFECDPWPEDVDEVTDDVDTEIDYGSDVTFYPQITVTLSGDSTFVQVALTSTGAYVRIDDTLVDGDVIVFDMATCKATVNGSNAPVSISSLFFGVPTGNQTITVTADDTYTASMAYRRRYKYA